MITDQAGLLHEGAPTIEGCEMDGYALLGSGGTFSRIRVQEFVWDYSMLLVGLIHVWGFGLEKLGK